MSFENMKNDFLWNKLLEIKRKKKHHQDLKQKTKQKGFFKPIENRKGFHSLQSEIPICRFTLGGLTQIMHLIEVCVCVCFPSGLCKNIKTIEKEEMQNQFPLASSS